MHVHCTIQNSGVRDVWRTLGRFRGSRNVWQCDRGVKICPK